MHRLLKINRHLKVCLNHSYAVKINHGKLTMKKYPIALMLAFASFGCFADQYVRPHVRSDGTYVQGYTKSSPNSSAYDNYSHQGNTNPYTGEKGSRQNESITSPSYSNPYNTNNGLYGNGGYGQRQ